VECVEVAAVDEPLYPKSVHAIDEPLPESVDAIDEPLYPKSPLNPGTQRRVIGASLACTELIPCMHRINATKHHVSVSDTTPKCMHLNSLKHP